VPLREPKHAAGQPHAETAISDGQQGPRALEAGHLRDRLGKLRRFAERRDAKHSSRSAVQNHPVVNALRSEELRQPCSLMLASCTQKVLQSLRKGPLRLLQRRFV
jgi:hypothetical protein